MYTSCPACGTTVDVATEALGSSDGAAYCDVCQAPFSALKQLARDAGDARPDTVTTDAPTSKKRRRGRRGGRRKNKPALARVEPPADGSVADTTETADTTNTADAAPIPDTSVASAPASSTGLRWTLAVLVACIGIGLMHINRERLADLPIVGPVLIRSYANLGQPLAPRWQLSGYAIRGSLGLPSEPGSLSFKVLIENTASTPQPPPLLRVVLQDAFGATLGHRDLTPADYLDGARPTLMPPGGRVTANATFADVSPDAVGFELDVCLESSGRVRCQTDDRTAATP
jgi:hypothetical protein